MHEPSYPFAELEKTVHGAMERLRARLVRHAPQLARHFASWTERLSPTGRAEDYYLANRAPLLLFPRLLAAHCAPPDSSFQADVAYSTVNGYYFVRLLDNVMDRQGDMELRLLPLAGFFHSEFCRTYTYHFPPDSEFWSFSDAAWIAMADAAVEAGARSEWALVDFERITARRSGGGKIALAAVCFHYRRPDLLHAWCALFDAFSGWSQMVDDLFDWVRDSSAGISTYFLSEAQRRKGPRESAARWVLREGFAWAYAQTEERMRRVLALAEEVHGAELVRYLASLQEQIARLRRDLEPQLAPLERLAGALELE